MMEAVRQLQHDKSKSVAKLAQETFQKLQHVNARLYLPATHPLPQSSTEWALFASPPLSTPSPPLAELPAWPSEPPRACTQVQRRTNFQEALCLFSEVTGLCDDTTELPDIPASLPAHAAAATAAAPLTSLLRPPRPRVSPPGVFKRPPQFLPLLTPPKSLPSSAIVDSAAVAASMGQSTPQKHFSRNDVAAAAAQSDVQPDASSVAGAGDSHTGTLIGHETAPAAESFNPLSCAPESPVLTAVNSTPTDELPLIPHDWSCCERDSTPGRLVHDGAHADDSAACTWRSQFTDAEVADMLREIEHESFSPVAVPVPALDAQRATLPPLSDHSVTPPPPHALPPAQRSRALRLGAALGGAAVFAALSVMWRAWHAVDFETIV